MTPSQLVELLQHPTETLAVEIKGWLDPEDPIDCAKIVRALMALRNYDGGVLIIGFGDKNGTLLEDSRPQDVADRYHADKVQALIGRHSRPAFEVDVHFVPINTVETPVIVVRGGLTFPVMARSTVRDPEGRPVLEQNAVYTRCLANDCVSSCKPVRPEDWDDLFARCFANREVHVGRFIQRHIPQLLQYLPSVETIPSAVATPTSNASVVGDIDDDVILEFINHSEVRFRTRVAELQQEGKAPELPSHGSWEATCIIVGSGLNYTASTKFLDELFIHQPRYTGWPMWRDTRSSQNELHWPYTYDKGWEALVIRLRETFFYNHIDFWRIEPRGRFYEYRALEDDITAERGNQQIPPLKVLDFLLPIARVSEAIAVCLQYANGLECPSDTAVLKFGFRWRKLRGRELTSWVEPGRTLFAGSTALQDEVVSFVEVPLATPIAQVPHFARLATIPLFEAFGKEFAAPIYEEIGAKTLQRR